MYLAVYFVVPECACYRLDIELDVKLSEFGALNIEDILKESGWQYRVTICTSLTKSY